jgi:hypothetical protein
MKSGLPKRARNPAASDGIGAGMLTGSGAFCIGGGITGSGTTIDGTVGGGTAGSGAIIGAGITGGVMDAGRGGGDCGAGSAGGVIQALMQQQSSNSGRESFLSIVTLLDHR